MTRITTHDGGPVLVDRDDDLVVLRIPAGWAEVTAEQAYQTAAAIALAAAEATS